MKNIFEENDNITNKGITLIALIITVIVLLILAGTAISISINGGDIFSKASSARDEWNIAVANEQTNLDELLGILNIVTNGTPSDLPAGWYAEAVASAYPSKDATQKAPIPKGFVVSSVSTENSISNGLVIYEGTEAVTDANHETAMTSRNQYVWIPVSNINDMIMCKSRTDASECDIDFVDGVLKCKNHSATEDELCGRMYNENIDYENPTVIGGKEFYSGTMATTKNGQTWNIDNSHEPDLAAEEDIITQAAQTQVETDFYSMAESVATYGGFYIARYEAQANAESKKGQDVVSSRTHGQSWYELYGALRKQIKNNGTTTLVGQMIWGSQYDQVIKFIGSSAQTGHSYQATSVASSGANSNDSLKNIYDLEGNISEWTQEALPQYRIDRGGSYELAIDDCCFMPASMRRACDPGNVVTIISSRHALYVPLNAGNSSLDGVGSIRHRGMN